jgi:hypothetical protein
MALTLPEPLTCGDKLRASIKLTVGCGMQLRIHPSMIGFDGENQWSSFEVTQPKELDDLLCRAEFALEDGTVFFHLLDDHTIPLTANIAQQGLHRLQLVYLDTDGTTVGKTNLVRFRIGASINATGEGNPDFVDGLTHLEARAITDATVSNDALVFTNLADETVAEIPLRELGAGGSTEPQVSYPEAGIAVSSGSAWQASINPATVPRIVSGSFNQMNFMPSGTLGGHGMNNINATNLTGMFLLLNDQAGGTLPPDGFATRGVNLISVGGIAGYEQRLQIISDPATGKVWTRTYTSNTWTSWAQIATKQYVDDLQAKVNALEIRIAQLESQP